MSILRYMVPSEDLMADPEVAAFFKDSLASIRSLSDLSKRAILYGCRGGSLQNIGIMYPSQLSIDADGHDISATDGFASKVLAEFPKTLQDACRQAKSIGQWKLFTRTPLERLARGRVVVIGDAAHPMPPREYSHFLLIFEPAFVNLIHPVRAQGASMAIEDAAALGVLLSKIDSKEEISTRLDMFNKLRLKRVAATQLLSAEHRWDPTVLSEEQRGYFDGKVPREWSPC
ncbi:6-hydroxynicotinate 3-monooxygenase [Colletotrichum spaethianum]|uniref:6-hydroxynicotinate 3-monooxygenase n=1 Tax=Colletotrichum spaethianum TaxID=700344 RepID=A0AA37P1F9_9PEZI|nr:6-hydroxynicotinate 3-monooxygenase [Colletotrichum spaethianum]GKT44843.1 6-hydroxynicotinate 3-monooxygenase [Colletotrichum spaethianum]